MASRVLYSSKEVWLPMIAVVGVLMAGCAAGGPVPGAVNHTDEAAPVVNAPPALIEAALDDAAQRTGMPRVSIVVVRADGVVWPDGSLGCPQPGMMYTQALVPGFRIVLRAGDQLLHYTAGTRGGPAFCPADRAGEPADSGANPAT